jgi:hypothetical protein
MTRLDPAAHGAGPDSRAIRLRLAQPWSGDLDRARRALSADAGHWLGRPLGESDGGERRLFETDLIMPLRGTSTHMVLRKAAIVELGRVVEAREALEVEVSWRSANLAPLFPVFGGVLTAAPTELSLDGYYAPPGGEMGVILDRALLNVGARGTARWFLAKVAQAIEDALDTDG